MAVYNHNMRSYQSKSEKRWQYWPHSIFLRFHLLLLPHWGQYLQSCDLLAKQERERTQFWMPNKQLQSIFILLETNYFTSLATTSQFLVLLSCPMLIYVKWFLLALLTALRGLLARPDVDDPLVPEIARKYLEDYDGYCENAKLYTKRFATGARPAYEDLIFTKEVPTSNIESDPIQAKISSAPSVVDGNASIQSTFRAIHGDKATPTANGKSTSPIPWRATHIWKRL